MDTRPHVPGYRLGELIARGSSATVWAAAPSDSDRDLAAKVVPLDRDDDGACLARELSALATTRGDDDDHLVRVVDVVAVSDPAPAVAIVMERLRHGTLTRLVTTRGHLIPSEVVTVLTPVALTAARLHDTAVVHGDLSPSNIGFDARGRPVVLDLGVSSVIGTPRVEIWGTPGFVAPEVVAGEPPTPSADVYAIGAVGWYALTGEPPPIPAERPPLQALRPDVPEAMRAALERALHPEPDQRGDGRELATAIYGSTPAAPIEPGEGTDEATMLTHRVRELARAAQPERRSRSEQSRRARHADLRARSRQAHLRVVATLVAAVLMGVVGVAVAVTGRGAGETPLAPASGSHDRPLAAPSRTGRPVDYRGVVEGLIQARARAWTTGDPAVLTAAFAESSTALEGDLGRLAEAARAGHRYEGLQFSLNELRLVAESEDRLDVVATIATSTYAVRTEVAGRTSVASREATTATVELVLLRSDAGWRISEVEPVAA